MRKHRARCCLYLIATYWYSKQGLPIGKIKRLIFLFSQRLIICLYKNMLMFILCETCKQWVLFIKISRQNLKCPTALPSWLFITQAAVSGLRSMATTFWNPDELPGLHLDSKTDTDLHTINYSGNKMSTIRASIILYSNEARVLTSQLQINNILNCCSYIPFWTTVLHTVWCGL